MATAEQRTWAETYRRAALQHSSLAGVVHELGRYAPANYLAGLSVECILRAYRTMVDPVFDSRHDLPELFKASRLDRFVTARRRDQLVDAIAVVASLWSNDHRYVDDLTLRRRWKKRGLYKGVRGDFVKERNRQLIAAASEIVSMGATQWTSSFRS